MKNKIYIGVLLLFFVFFGIFSLTKTGEGSSQEALYQYERVLKIEKAASNLFDFVYGRGEEEIEKALTDLLNKIEDIKKRIEPKIESQENEVIRAQRNLRNFDSYGMDIEMNYKKEGGEFLNFLGNVKVESLENNIKIEGIIKGKDNYAGEIELEGYLSYINDNIYGRMDDFHVEDISEREREEAEEYLGKDALIVRKPLDKIDILIEEVSRELFFYGFDVGDIDIMKGEDILNEIKEISLRSLDRNIIKVVDVQSDILNGKSVKKYETKINEENMVDFFFELMDDYGIFEFLPISKEDKKELKEEMMYAIEESNDDTKSYLWIDNGRILKTKSTTTYEEYDFWKDEIEEVKIEFVVNYHSFNKNFNLTPPSEYIDVDKMIEEEMQRAQWAAENATRKSSVTQARSLLEVEYAMNSSYNKAMENEELRDIKEEYDLVLHTRDKSYCVAVDLEGGDNFCVDNTNFPQEYSGNISCSSFNVSCK